MQSASVILWVMSSAESLGMFSTIQLFDLEAEPL